MVKIYTNRIMKFRMGYNYCHLIPDFASQQLAENLSDYWNVSVEAISAIFQEFKDKESQKSKVSVKNKHLSNYDFFLYVSLKIRDLNRMKRNYYERIILSDGRIMIDGTYEIPIQNFTTNSVLNQVDFTKMLAQYSIDSKGKKTMNSLELANDFERYVHRYTPF